MSNPYAYQARPVAELSVDARAQFLTKTYVHVLGAIVGFIAVEVLMFQAGLADRFIEMLSGSRFGWLMVLGAFMGVSWLATSFAQSSRPLPAQYGGLALYVVAEAVIFLPMIWMADRTAGGGVIQTAAGVTLGVFLGLTAIVFTTRKDFSFLRGIIRLGFIAALVLIVAAAFTSLSLGLWFSIAMALLAAAMILYNTSNVLHHYPEDAYVSAALGLFAGVALLFWYVLRIFMHTRD